MRGLERNPDKSKSEELAGAISCMGPDEKCFSLLLTHEYTEKSITSMGSDALKGIDRARVESLMEANGIAGREKALQFFFAALTHDASFYDAGGEWEEDKHKESITWYSFRGKKLGTTSKTEFDLNFLNPDQDTLAQIWEERGESTFEGYLGNEGATRNTTYSRYAVVAWPLVRGVANTLEFINASAAIEALQAQRPVAPEMLRTFINAVGDKVAETQAAYLREHAYSYTEPKKVSMSVEFSRTLSELLVEADDTSLVNLFFDKVCSNVRDKDNAIPTIIALIFDGLDDGPAKQALLAYAVKDAVNLRHERLCSSKALGSLWNWTLRCGDESTIETLANKFKEMDPTLLSPVVDVFSQQFVDLDRSDKKFSVLASIATVRIEWLKAQVGPNDKPFTWEMPDAVFPDNARIQAFLRGPEMSMTSVGVRAFSGLPDARKYANRASQTKASFKMEAAGRGKDAYVTITKTREWFAKQNGKSAQYKAELQLLTDRFGDIEREEGPAQKRARTQ
ncbi:hypothetical protein ON010_g13165 [Phytophthora cinnamomi]|nr:hypothetical protein ON010_g13165 [Phytophthora cinnamomi]